MMRSIIFMCFLLLWYTVNSMEKPNKKPMKKPMMSAGFCLKEDDMMKFCISASSFDPKLAIVQQRCHEDSSSVAADNLIRRIRTEIKQRRRPKRPKKPKKPKKPTKPTKKPGKPKPPKECLLVEVAAEKLVKSYEEEICTLDSFGWISHALSLPSNAEQSLHFWANTSNIETDISSLPLALAGALLPLLDDPPSDDIAKCYKDAESYVKKKIFPECSLEFDQEEFKSLMDAVTWVECFHSIFEDACNEYVEDAVMNLISGETTSTTPSSQTTATTPSTGGTAIESSGCKCGMKRITRIVGGSETEINEYPWMASIANSQESQFCGGALIASEWILTASHCMFKDSAGTMPLTAEEILVVLGEHHLYDDTESVIPKKAVKVSMIIKHSDYDASSLNNDIALLKLSEKVDLNTYTPVCLPQTDANYEGKNAWVYGWGTTSSGGPSSDKLLEVNVPVVSNTVCQQVMPVGITDAMLCAGGELNKDGCQGDSGGPLSVDVDGAHVLIGDVSFGNGCGQEGQYGIYGDVAHFRKWIDDNLNSSGGTEFCPA